MVNHITFAHFVRNGSNHYLLPVVSIVMLNGRMCPYDYPSAACIVSIFDSVITVDNAARRKIRGFYVLHQFVCGYVIIIYIGNNTVDTFAQIVRSHVCGHTHRYTVGTVDQKIGYSCRQNNGFFQRIVEIVLKINRIFIYILQQFRCYFGHSGFGVTHCCRRIVVHRTEITLSVHQWVTQRPFLCQTYQSTVNGRIAVRMVFTQYITHYSGRFLVFSIVSHSHIAHCEHYTALYGLHSVPCVRQRPCNDYAHCIVDIGLFHLGLYINPLYSFVFFHSLIKIMCKDTKIFRPANDFNHDFFQKTRRFNKFLRRFKKFLRR